MMTVTPILTKAFALGTSGQAYRVRTFTGGTEVVFDIRTRSPRRYLVIDVPTRAIFMRTDSARTAERKRAISPFRRIIVDTVAVNREARA